jgi:hypothetical protein
MISAKYLKRLQEVFPKIDWCLMGNGDTIWGYLRGVCGGPIIIKLESLHTSGDVWLAQVTWGLYSAAGEVWDHPCEAVQSAVDAAHKNFAPVTHLLDVMPKARTGTPTPDELAIMGPTDEDNPTSMWVVIPSINICDGAFDEYIAAFASEKDANAYAKEKSKELFAAAGTPARTCVPKIDPLLFYRRSPLDTAAPVPSSHGYYFPPIFVLARESGGRESLLAIIRWVYSCEHDVLQPRLKLSGFITTRGIRERLARLGAGFLALKGTVGPRAACKVLASLGIQEKT